MLEIRYVSDIDKLFWFSLDKHLEEYLDIPALTVDSNCFTIGETWVRIHAFKSKKDAI